MAISIKPFAIPNTGYASKIILAQVVATSTSTPLWTIETPAAGTTAIDLGDAFDTDVVQSPNKTEKKNDGGNVNKVSVVYDRKTTATLAQEDMDLLDFLRSTVKGKRYLEFVSRGYINLKYQWIAKFVEVTPQLKSTRPVEGAGNPYESTGIDIPATQSISAATLVSIAAVLSLSNFPTATLSLTYADKDAIIEV